MLRSGGRCWLSIIGAYGCETQELTRGGVTVVSGFPFFSTTALPPDSASSACLTLGSGGHIRRPWWNGEPTAATPLEPSGTEYVVQFRYRTSTNSGTANDVLRLGVGRNGSGAYIAVSAEDSTNKLTLVVNGSVVATAVSDAFGINQWARVHLEVDQQSGGDINVYLDGDFSAPVLTHTITGGEAAGFPGKPNEFVCLGKTGGVDRVDDLIAMDTLDAVYPDDRNDIAEASIQRRLPNGAGNYTDWSGTFADIDEVPNSDTDYIEATAVDEASTFAFEDTAEDRVLHVQVYARVTRTGSSAGLNMDVRARESATDDDNGPHPAPGSGDVIVQFPTKPSGGAWTPATFNASEFGPVSRT